MKKFFKQMFCLHIFKETKEEFLEKRWEYIYQAMISSDFRKTYFNHYAIHKYS